MAKVDRDMPSRAEQRTHPDVVTAVAKRGFNQHLYGSQRHIIMGYPDGVNSQFSSANALKYRLPRRRNLPSAYAAHSM